MAQSQIICDASAMGKTRVIRTKSWDRSHDFAPVGGALRTPAACRKFFRHRHTRRGPNLSKLKLYRLIGGVLRIIWDKSQNSVWDCKFRLRFNVCEYCLTSMSGTSNQRLPPSTGKNSPPRSDIDHWKWTSEEQHLSRATKMYVADWCCSTEVRQ